MRVAFQEMIAHKQSKLLWRLDPIILGQHVDRIFLGVCGYYVGIIAYGKVVKCWKLKIRIGEYYILVYVTFC